MAEQKYEKIIEANGFPNVFQQAMSDYYWLLENDYWLLNMIDYNQIIDSSWLFWLPEGNLINPEPSNEPTLGPSVRGSFPVSPVAAFSRIFFARHATAWRAGLPTRHLRKTWFLDPLATWKWKRVATY